MWLGSNVYCAIAGLFMGKPVVASFHGMVYVSEKEPFMVLKFAMINRGASRIVAVSKSLVDDIAGRTPLNSNKMSTLR